MPQTDDQCNLHLMLMILPSHEQHHVFENVMLVFYILLHCLQIQISCANNVNSNTFLTPSLDC